LESGNTLLRSRVPSQLNGMIGNIQSNVNPREVVLGQAALEFACATSQCQGPIDRQPALEVSLEKVLKPVSWQSACNLRVDSRLHPRMLEPVGYRTIGPDVSTTPDVLHPFQLASKESIPHATHANTRGILEISVAGRCILYESSSGR